MTQNREITQFSSHYRGKFVIFMDDSDLIQAKTQDFPSISRDTTNLPRSSNSCLLDFSLWTSEKWSEFYLDLARNTRSFQHIRSIKWCWALFISLSRLLCDFWGIFTQQNEKWRVNRGNIAAFFENPYVPIPCHSAKVPACTQILQRMTGQNDDKTF